MADTITTLALGEEDGALTTLALGEEDGPTTLRLGEEDKATTLALGEEGGDGGAVSADIDNPFGGF